MAHKKDILLAAKNLKKSYVLDNRSVPIFADLSVDIYAGDHVAIMGASGSGKSTLLTLLAGLDKPDSGQILLAGDNITKKTEDQLAKMRRTDFGFIFQSFHLIPSLSTLENVMFPLELLGVSTAKAKTKAREMLARVNLEHRLNSFPYQLSGGERQRTAIARALIHEPKVLFADEPTGNLDEDNSDQVLALLLKLREEVGSALVVVTHELDIAKKADRILTLEHGIITASK